MTASVALDERDTHLARRRSRHDVGGRERGCPHEYRVHWRRGEPYVQTDEDYRRGHVDLEKSAPPSIAESADVTLSLALRHLPPQRVLAALRRTALRPSLLIAKRLELLECHDLRAKQSGQPLTALVALRSENSQIARHVDMARFLAMRVKKPCRPPMT